MTPTEIKEQLAMDLEVYSMMKVTVEQGWPGALEELLNELDPAHKAALLESAERHEKRMRAMKVQGW